MNTGADGVSGREFTYRTVDGGTTGQITSLRYDELEAKDGYTSFAFQYTYDARGNIASYTAPGETTVIR